MDTSGLGGMQRSVSVDRPLSLVNRLCCCDWQPVPNGAAGALAGEQGLVHAYMSPGSLQHLFSQSRR
jgi:hypothetical protein